MGTPGGRDERHDIETRADCERLVRAFYGRALSDPVIGFLFTDVARLDLEAHVPQITSFWETILLGAQSYGGGAFAPHVSLHRQVPLKAGHFQRWLALWRATVDELFAGPRAELAKAHAQRVADAFHRRLETLDAPDVPDGAGSFPALLVTRHDPPAR
jgi:hemoglobin